MAQALLFDLDGTLIDSSDDLTRAESRFRRAWLGRALARSVKYIGSHSIIARARGCLLRTDRNHGLARNFSCGTYTSLCGESYGLRIDTFSSGDTVGFGAIPLISTEPIFQATALANAQMVAQRATHGHPTIQPSHLFLVPTGLDQAVFLEQDHRHNSNQVVAAGADASATRVHTAEGIGECLPKTFIMRQV